MKADLTRDFVLRLLPGQPPSDNGEGKLVPKPPAKPKGAKEPSIEIAEAAKVSDAGAPSYIVWDTNADAPAGFGVRVRAGKAGTARATKTYILRRKVRGKSIMAKVGNVSDYDTIAQARTAAREVARKIESTGANPNEEARKLAVAEITLGAAFMKYRAHLASRTQRPAGPETLKVIDRGIRRFAKIGWIALDSEPSPAEKAAKTKEAARAAMAKGLEWEPVVAPPPVILDRGVKVHELPLDDILKEFKAGKGKATANEHAFRWASAAVRWTIDMETLAAAAAKREPLLTANPFMILTLSKQYRSNEQLGAEREKNGARRPLEPSATLGPFLEAAWAKRATYNHATGIDYIVLMLLWGCRKSEHAPCQWGELLTAPERLATSHVWLGAKWEEGYVYFHKTKNSRSHKLPLGRFAWEMLRRRQEEAAQASVELGFGRMERRYVFPRRNKNSNVGHYSDASDLLDGVREEAGIAKLTRHDLRRSFGSLMTSLEVPERIAKAFLNHAGSTTDSYTPAEWRQLRDWIERIEQAALSKAPNVYNALKPVDWPMLPAPAPHVLRPQAKRPGRPRKHPKEAAGEA